MTEMEQEQKDVSEKVAEAVKDLLQSYWPDILDTMADEPKFGVNFPVMLRREGNGWRIETKISFSKKVSDSRDDYVDCFQEPIVFE